MHTTSPDVCISRSRTVIGRAAGTEPAMAPTASSVATFMSVRCSGRCLLAGSSITRRPCSARVRAATVVIGLVIEAMLKMVSTVIGTPAALSRQP